MPHQAYFLNFLLSHNILLGPGYEEIVPFEQGPKLYTALVEKIDPDMLLSGIGINGVSYILTECIYRV